MIDFNIVIVVMVSVVIGSYIGAITYRIPKNVSTVVLPSNCPKCKKKLTVIQLIPIIGYLLQLGKCFFCKQSISPRYILIEISSLLIFLLTYFKYQQIDLKYLSEIFIYLSILAMIVTDLEYLIIPRVFLIFLAFAILIYANFRHMYFLETALPVSITLYLLGILISKIKKKPSLGFGDVQFMLLAGCLFPPVLIPSFLFIAGCFGIILSIIFKQITGKTEFPFIPALALSSILCFNNINILTF